MRGVRDESLIMIFRLSDGDDVVCDDMARAQITIMSLRTLSSVITAALRERWCALSARVRICRLMIPRVFCWYFHCYAHMLLWSAHCRCDDVVFVTIARRADDDIDGGDMMLITQRAPWRADELMEVVYDKDVIITTCALARCCCACAVTWWYFQWQPIYDDVWWRWPDGLLFFRVTWTH